MQQLEGRINNQISRDKGLSNGVMVIAKTMLSGKLLFIILNKFETYFEKFLRKHLTISSSFAVQ